MESIWTWMHKLPWWAIIILLFIALFSIAYANKKNNFIIFLLSIAFIAILILTLILPFKQIFGLSVGLFLGIFLGITICTFSTEIEESIRSGIRKFIFLFSKPWMGLIVGGIAGAIIVSLILIKTKSIGNNTIIDLISAIGTVSAVIVALSNNRWEQKRTPEIEIIDNATESQIIPTKWSVLAVNASSTVSILFLQPAIDIWQKTPKRTNYYNKYGERVVDNEPLIDFPRIQNVKVGEYKKSTLSREKIINILKDVFIDEFKNDDKATDCCKNKYDYNYNRYIKEGNPQFLKDDYTIVIKYYYTINNERTIIDNKFNFKVAQEDIEKLKVGDIKLDEIKLYILECELRGLNIVIDNNVDEKARKEKEKKLKREIYDLKLKIDQAKKDSK
ncbi:hypothetical protein PT285_11025 [Lactobacillus sp. ESL0791]|uniref:hypothetical protein n=1 Tax=Lactobacillus sp. ESL0791 TaxID=2983234 RepID=UPI0023FA2E0D|nr:hypothetical protein [Lactobacillus sp. ESL0791]MDF7639933.1 hypothetical protein [Lactobacillus sp. ESL0791]